MRRSLPYLLLGLAALFWAGNFMAARALRDDWPPLPLNAARWTIAAAVMVPFAWSGIRTHAATLWAHRGWLVAVTLPGMVAYQTLVYTALSTTTVVTAAVIVATAPAAIALLATLLDGVRLSTRQVGGIALSLAGALAVAVGGDVATLVGLRLTPGDGWMLAAVPCWAVYSVLLRRSPVGVPQSVVVAATSLLAASLLLPLAAWRMAAGEAVRLTPASVAGVLYIGVIAAAVGFVFWNRGVAAIGAPRAGVFLHLMPLFAALLGMAFLGERLEPYHLLGGLLVVSGVALTSSRGRRQDAAT